MIRPAGFRGAVFGSATDGNGRDDAAARAAIASELRIRADWASVRQVHGASVLQVDSAGTAGEGDGLITDRRGLPLVVATADCLPIIIEGDSTVAVVHAGWRGIAAGIVPAGLQAMVALGDIPRRAAIGPSIGPCCYEVGDDVRAAIAGHESTTTWSTPSIDLWSAAASHLGGLDVWQSRICTHTDSSMWSHRRDGTTQRQVSVAWLPPA